MSKEEWEKNYRPSQWSKRMGPELIVEDHVRTTTSQSLKAREVVQNQQMLYYGQDKNEKIWLFGTNLPRSSPMLVYFSGGYWQMLSGEISAYPVKPMFEHGVVAAIVDYPRVPQAKNVSSVVDAAVRATQCVLKHALSSGCGSLVLMGHSAGAQLVSMVLASEWFLGLEAREKSCFSSVFLLSGVYDLRPLLNTSINETLAMSELEAEQNSPMLKKKLIANNLSDADIEVVVVLAENEAPGLAQQSRDFHQALEGEGVKRVSLKIVADVDHFDLVERLESDRYVITQEVIKGIKARVEANNQH